MNHFEDSEYITIFFTMVLEYFNETKGQNSPKDTGNNLAPGLMRPTSQHLTGIKSNHRKELFKIDVDCLRHWKHLGKREKLMH